MKEGWNDNILKLVQELEDAEKELENLPMTFAEIFKDEINANDEHKMYNGVKRTVKKYSGDRKAISAIDEFIRVITGGTTMEQIFLIAREETSDPTPAVELSVDESSRLADRQ